MSYTPGPWIAEYSGPESKDGYAILTDKGWGHDLPWIASAHGTNVSVKDPAEIAANAFLIAAAPEMYEALLRAHSCATLRDDGTCDGCFVSEVLAKAVPK